VEKLYFSRKPRSQAESEVGAGNDYGHPHAEILKASESFEVYRTDLDGSIAVTTGWIAYTVITQKSGSEVENLPKKTVWEETRLQESRSDELNWRPSSRGGISSSTNQLSIQRPEPPGRMGGDHKQRFFSCFFVWLENRGRQQQAHLYISFLHAGPSGYCNPAYRRGKGFIYRTLLGLGQSVMEQ
jgi:hypothetical protein